LISPLHLRQVLEAHVAIHDLPLVVLVGEERANEPHDRAAVGEDPDDVATTAQFAALLGLVDQICQWS